MPFDRTPCPPRGESVTARILCFLPKPAALILAWTVAGPALAGPVLAPAELIELEELLDTLGFAPGPVDGTVDARTEAAIARYHEFAFIANKEPLPDQALLDELRSVARRMTAIQSGERQVDPDALLATGDDVVPELPDRAAPETAPTPEPAPATAEPPIPVDGPSDPTDEPLPEIEAATALQAALPQPPPPQDLEPPADAAATPPPAPGSAAPAGPAADFLDDALVSLEAGEVERAVALLTAALSFDPANVMAYQLRGSALTFKGDYDGAIRDFDKAAELVPDDPGIHQNRCWVLGQAGRFEAALRDCDRALDLDPASAAAHHSRAQVFEAMGKFQDALADYADALRLDPDSPEVTQDARRVGLIE